MGNFFKRPKLGDTVKTTIAYVWGSGQHGRFVRKLPRLDLFEHIIGVIVDYDNVKIGNEFRFVPVLEIKSAVIDSRVPPGIAELFVPERVYALMSDCELV
jgi:hypothetical protein